jgi:hypothetical protein
MRDVDLHGWERQLLLYDIVSLPQEHWHNIPKGL